MKIILIRLINLLLKTLFDYQKLWYIFNNKNWLFFELIFNFNNIKTYLKIQLKKQIRNNY